MDSNYFCHAYSFTRYNHVWVTPSEANINFLEKLTKNNRRHYMVFDNQFDKLIQSLILKGFIEIDSYQYKTLTVRGYFRITSLGRDYLAFSEL